jgi:hypothetical protein
MSTTLPVRSGSLPATRTRVLAAASAAVAVASVSITIAVSSGGGAEAPAAPSGQPATAQPDAATQYHNSIPQRSEPIGTERGRRAAEQFHHFR